MLQTSSYGSQVSVNVTLFKLTIYRFLEASSKMERVSLGEKFISILSLLIELHASFSEHV